MLRNSEPTAFAKIVLHIYVPSVDLRKTSIKGMFLVQLYTTVPIIAKPRLHCPI